MLRTWHKLNWQLSVAICPNYIMIFVISTNTSNHPKKGFAWKDNTDRQGGYLTNHQLIEVRQPSSNTDQVIIFFLFNCFFGERFPTPLPPGLLILSSQKFTCYPLSIVAIHSEMKRGERK